MNTPHNLKRTIAGALLSGGVAIVGLGLAAGTAQADPQSPGPFQWCPGQPLPGTPAMPVAGLNVTLPATHVVWNNSVCHTYWRTPAGRGNVPMNDGPNSNFWDGPNPPPYWEPMCPPYFAPPTGCRRN
jgi:hypothetical protein